MIQTSCSEMFWWSFARIKLWCDVGDRFFDGGIGNKFGDRLWSYNLNVGSWVTTAVLIVCHSNDSHGTMEECFFVVLADLLSEFACLWLKSKTFGWSMIGFVKRRCSLLEWLMNPMVERLCFGTILCSTVDGIPGETEIGKIYFVVYTMMYCPRKFNFGLYVLRKTMRCR